MSDSNPAGWLPDPTGRHEHRYWDGSQWTDNISNAGVAGSDAYDTASAASAAAEPPPPTWADPTTATPIPPADPTAAWSAAPGAPVPPMPAPMAAGSGGGGSKKGLVIGGVVLAAVAAVVALALSGGGSSGASDAVKGKLVSYLTTDDGGGLSNKDAGCVVDVMDKELGSQLNDISFKDGVPSDPPASLDAKYQAALLKANSECNLGLTGTPGDSTTTTTSAAVEDTTTTTGSSSADGGTDGSGLPPNFGKILADTYEKQFGLSKTKAECLAGKITEAIQSGDLNADAAGSAVFDFLTACDISISELTPKG